MSGLDVYVRLDTMRHDASSEPSSQFERRYIAYLLSAQRDLWEILHSGDEKPAAMRTGTPSDVIKLHKDAYEAVTNLLFDGYGFSKWDLRTTGWMCNGVFYGDEIVSEQNARNQCLFELLANYEMACCRGTHESITGELNWDKHQGGPELLMTDEQKKAVIKFHYREQKRVFPDLELTEEQKALLAE